MLHETSSYVVDRLRLSVSGHVLRRWTSASARARVSPCRCSSPLSRTRTIERLLQAFVERAIFGSEQSEPLVVLAEFAGCSTPLLLYT